MQAMEISRTGLDVEWRRLEVIAQNIANVNSTGGADGQAYTAMRLVSGPKASFKALTAADGSGLTGVSVLGLEPAPGTAHKVYQPGAPNADADGFVTTTGVDQVGQMTQMVQTERAYEANVVAMNAARQMYARAMDIGKRS